MIKTNRGETKMSGNGFELMADLTIIVHTLCYEVMMKNCNAPYDGAKATIMDAVECGLRTGEEIERECDEKKHDVLIALDDALGGLKNLLKRMGDL